MKPYIHKSFFYSKAVSYLRFYESAGVLVIGWRNGRALRYTEASVADFERLSRSRCPGKTVNEWLAERRQANKPRGIEMPSQQVMSGVVLDDQIDRAA